MPQLIPFYFFNQLVITFAVWFFIILVFSKYILPSFSFLQIIRIYITKLSKKN